MKMTVLALACALLGSAVGASTLPSPRVPDGLGVNIHFTGEPARDLDMIQAAGFRFIRMDFNWQGIEKQKGVYDFATYDQLVNGLEKRGIRALFILDYSNPLYEQGNQIITEEGRQAFAKWAGVAAARYKNRGIVWELYNEPNIGFWLPQPSLEPYMKLAHAVAPAIRKADPKSIFIAPATSTIDMAFLEGCFQRGLLKLVDGVSVHPYRQNNPETVIGEYAKLRAMIATYSPTKPNIPIISGEWGYSNGWLGFTEEMQGQYMPRELLTNLSQGIPISIYYDWHDDGPDPKEPEHHFGTVTLDYKPKPSYLAMQRLTRALAGMHFVKRLGSADKDYLFLFTNGKKSTVAAWTIGDSHPVTLYPGKKVTLSKAPQYFPVPSSAKAILAEAAWSAKSTSALIMPGTGAPAGLVVNVANPFRKSVTIRVKAIPSQGITGRFTSASSFVLRPGAARTLRWRGTPTRRDTAEIPVTIEVSYDKQASKSVVAFQVGNQITAGVALSRTGVGEATLSPATGLNGASLVVNSPTGKQRFALRQSGRDGAIRVTDASGRSVESSVSMGRLSVPVGPLASSSALYRVTLLRGDTTIADSGPVRLSPLDISTRNVSAIDDGDMKLQSKFTLTDTPDGGLSFVYEYPTGWKFVRVAPKQKLPIQGTPHSLGAWVKGDNSGVMLRMRFVDSTGRFFQPDFGRVNFTGWRYMTAALDDPHTGSWGGTGTGDRIVGPISIDTLILADSIGSAMKGSLEFAGFDLIYKGK